MKCLDESTASLLVSTFRETLHQVRQHISFSKGFYCFCYFPPRDGIINYSLLPTPCGVLYPSLWLWLFCLANLGVVIAAFLTHELGLGDVDKLGLGHLGAKVGAWGKAHIHTLDVGRAHIVH